MRNIAFKLLVNVLLISASAEAGVLRVNNDVNHPLSKKEYYSGSLTEPVIGKTTPFCSDTTVELQNIFTNTTGFTSTGNQLYNLVPDVTGKCSITNKKHINTPSTPVAVLQSDGDWKATTNLYTNWEILGYDDSGWGMNVSPSPGAGSTPNCWTTPNIVQSMWGQAGENVVYLRKKFTLTNSEANNLFLMDAACDDDFIVYVNGSQIINDLSGGAGPLYEKVDISPFLHAGDNVIAIKAINTQCCYYGVCLRVFAYGPSPVNDSSCVQAVTLVPSADNSFSGTAGTINNARSSGPLVDCDYKQTWDVWYKFTATSSYHRIILRNADLPDSMRFQLWGGNCNFGGQFYPITCVLNSHDSTVYDATELVPGTTYFIKVYALSPFTENGDFEIGVVTPGLAINKGMNVLSNASFETPAMTAQATNVGNSFNGWFTRQGNPMAVLREVNYPIIFGPDTSSSGKQHIDILGHNDTIYHSFTLSTTSTVFFSGHFSNQAAQYYQGSYLPWTAFCGILDESGVMVAKSDIMNFTNKLTDRPWYQLSGTVYDLPPGNYKYIAYMSDYSNFDNAFVQTNFNCVLQSQPPTSITTSDNDNAICAGESITLTANGAILANGGAYAWYENECGDGAILSNTATLTVMPSEGTHHYYVRIEEDCGYTNCTTVTVTVHPPLGIGISSNFGNSNISICPGTTVSYFATAYNVGPDPVYQWKLNGVVVGSNSDTYVNTVHQDNEIVTCSVSNAVTGCTSVSNSIITSLYQNDVSVSISTSQTTACAGSAVTFTASGNNGGNLPVYNWKINGITVSSGYSNTFTSVVSNGDLVSCEMISSTACNNHATSNGLTITTVPPVTPSISIAITSGTNPDCSGAPIEFSATAVNGGSQPSFQWLLNGNPVGDGTSTFTLASPVNNDIVSCELTSNATCVSPAVAVSNEIFVKAQASSPAVTIGINGANPTCANGTIQFVAVYTDGGANPSFQWKLNGNPVGTNSVTYTKTGFTDGDQVTVIVTSNEPCASPAFAEAASITVSVYDVSTASLSIAGPSFVCEGTLAIYYAQADHAGPSPGFQWFKNGIPVGTEYIYTDNSLQDNDVITCSVTTDPVCASSITVGSINSITVSVSPAVTPTISISSANPHASLQNNFSASITNGGTAPVYEWRKNGIVVGTNSSTYIDMALLNGDEITCTLYSNATCVTSASAVSNSIVVGPPAYCIPTSIYSGVECQYIWITNVKLGTMIDRTSACGGYYEDFTATDTVRAVAGGQVDYVITGGTDGNNYLLRHFVFIDYNNDGDFDDAGEKMQGTVYMDLYTPASGHLTIPTLTAPGNYRVRVVVSWVSPYDPITSCEFDYGEAEDYILQVQQPQYCIPVISQPCDQWIANAVIGSINNSHQQPADCNAGGYTDYSSVLSTTAAPGQSVTVSLTGGGIDYPYAWQWADVFVDYNNDGDFDDDGERVIVNMAFSMFGSERTDFVIPPTQPYGLYRIRVKSYNYDSNVDSYTGPCGNSNNGAVQDYMLKVDCVPNGSDVVVSGNNIVITDGDDTPDVNDHTDFGNAELGTTVSKTYTITNSGTAVLNIGGITLSGGENGVAFSLTNPPQSNMLQPAESTSFTISFTAPSWGYGFNFNRYVHVATDNCSKMDYDFKIQATASCPANGPDINLQGNGIDIARFDFSPSTDDGTQYGTVTANTTISRTFSIQNTGNLPLHISGVQLSNYDNNQQFAVTTQPAAVVAPGSSTDFVVTFSPAGSGIRYSYIRVLSDDCDESYYDFKIEGTSACSAANPEIEITGNSNAIADGSISASLLNNTDFGVVAIGASTTHTFHIQNTGTDPLHISTVDISGTNTSSFTLVTAPATIVAPGTGSDFSVMFSPTVNGIQSATIHVRNDDCDEGDYDFAIKGTDGTPCTAVIVAPCSYVYISNVTMGTINNSSACNGGYSNYAATYSATAQQGETINFSVTNGGFVGQNIMIFGDLNADGDFDDPGEQLTSLIYSDAGTAATGSFVVPALQPYGSYGLRIVSDYFGYGIVEPCYNHNGEIEDYTLVVQPAVTTITANVKLFLEGFYSGSGTMDPNLSTVEISVDPSETDTITVNLWAVSSLANTDPDYSVKTVLHTDGTATVQFPAGVSGNAYYIAVKHRNHIETWSHDPVLFTGNVSYDFTQSLSAAYDDGVNPPMKSLGDGNFGIYAGDVNQDGTVDGQDMNVIDNNNGFFGYDSSDINGDGGTDGQDMNFVDNNSQLSLFFARPY